MAARARNGPLVGSGSRELQQFGQCGCPGMMHGRAHRHLDGLQIQVARFAAPLKMTCSSWSTSRATSWRIASAVFFPGLLADLLHRPHLADLFIDIRQLIAQFPEAPALGDLALRFRQAGRRGKCLGDGLAIHLACQPKVGTMAGIARPVAMAVRISATPLVAVIEPGRKSPNWRFGQYVGAMPFQIS